MDDQEQLSDCSLGLEVPGSKLFTGVSSAIVGSAICFSTPFLSPNRAVSECDRPKQDWMDNDELVSLPGTHGISSETTDRFGLLTPVASHLHGLLQNLSMPKSWIDEGISAPTPDCNRYSLQVLCRLFDDYGIIPYKVTISKEGGVFAAYKNPHNRNILRIEVDNELDVVAVVSDGKEILDSGLLEGDDLESSLIRSFDSKLASATVMLRSSHSFSG